MIYKTNNDLSNRYIRSITLWGGGLVENGKPPYLVVSTTPKIKRGMSWKVRKRNTVQMTIY